jgi:uncharacterized membrane protein YcjF (UPF0283 family)
MRQLLKTALHLILDGFVVLTMIATVGTIAALLPYAQIHQRITYWTCVAVAIVGVAAVVAQMRRLYRLQCDRKIINDLLMEGHNLVLTTKAANPSRAVETFPANTFDDLITHMAMADWCKHAEDVLKQRLGAAYVTRFHLGGSNIQDATSMTIWKMNHRLETLASFLLELGH